MSPLLLLAALAVQSSPQESGQTPGRVGASWAQTPQLEAPAALEFEGGEGHVKVTCVITVSGAARDCAVEEEVPEDLGLGAMVLGASPDFRFNPPTQDGVAVQDTATFTVRFKTEIEMQAQSGAHTSPELQRVLTAFDRLGFISGTCASYLPEPQRTHLEAGLALVTVDQGAPLPVFDQVLFRGYGRGKDSSEADPRGEAYCSASLNAAEAGLEAIAEDIAAAEASLPPSARRR